MTFCEVPIFKHVNRQSDLVWRGWLLTHTITHTYVKSGERLWYTAHLIVFLQYGVAIRMAKL